MKQKIDEGKLKLVEDINNKKFRYHIFRFKNKGINIESNWENNFNKISKRYLTNDTREEHFYLVQDKKLDPKENRTWKLWIKLFEIWRS